MRCLLLITYNVCKRLFDPHSKELKALLTCKGSFDPEGTP